MSSLYLFAGEIEVEKEEEEEEKTQSFTEIHNSKAN